MKTKRPIFIFLFVFLSIFSLVGFVKASVLGFDTSTPCTYWEDVFNFSMSAAGILTLVMLVLGGLYYIVSLGQEERLGNAKKMMTGAMAGFLLALFSYLIFQVISPSLLQCRLDIPDVILPEPISDSGSNGGSGGGSGGSYNPCAGVNEVDLFNSEDDCNARGGSDDGECDGSCIQSTVPVASGLESDSTDQNPVTETEDAETGDTETGDTETGSGDNTYKWCCQHGVGECPITFSSTDNGAGGGRAREFIENIESHLTTSGRQRIAEVGLAAVACQINFGSCGKTTDVIATTALRGSSTGLACNQNWHGGSCVTKAGIRSINGSQRSWMREVRCCSGGRDCEAVPECDNSGCTNSASEATSIVRERFERELPPDWPNEWIEQLQPGDEIYMYNGNSSCGASHSITFLGWNDDRGNAITIESGVSTPTQRGVRCLSSRCGREPVITMINRPQ